jgi:HPt (histidine-containing phosphotransfer) domain-containing protein
MTIKQKIIGQSVASTLLVATIGSARRREIAAPGASEAVPAHPEGSKSLPDAGPTEAPQAGPDGAAAADGEKLRSTLTDQGLRRFLPMFVAELPAMVAQMKALLKQHDFDSLQSLIHKINGAGGFYGFVPLTAAAALAEQQLGAAREAQAVAADVHALIDLIRRVQGYDPASEAVEPTAV